MRTPLPPLNALKAFEATARYGSLSQAAKELYVTQSAISKQIKLLEDFFAMPLFERKAQGVALTSAGQSFLPAITHALDEIRAASLQLRQHHHQTEKLTIDITPSLSSGLVIPELSDFHTRHPNTHVDLLTGDGDVNTAHSPDVDMYIRCFSDATPPPHSQLMQQEQLCLIISAEQFAQQPIRSANDLLHHHLNMQTTRPNMWPTLFKQLNLPIEEAQRGSGFEHFFMSIQAVKEGLGVSLAPLFLVRKALQEGILINPLGITMRSGYSYYLITPPYKREQRKNQVFSQWLIDKMSRL